MAVPLLDLKAQYASIRDEINAAVLRVLEAQAFILGPEVEALEQEIAAYSGCRYGVGVSSGTDALLLCLMVLEIRPGDEVILPTYTFFATAGAVARLGARPVFVDIDPRTYNMQVEAVERAITPRTRAIIPVHLYGQMADMPALMALAERHKLIVVEDAAQAICAEYAGLRAGQYGHMACFSFFPSKNLGGAGDGGMVITNDPDLSEKLRLYRNHGYKPKYYNRVVGGNFRLDAIQAAVLRVKLPYLDAWTQARQRNAAAYRQLLADVEGLRLPYELPNVRHVYNQFVVACERRDDLQRHLQAHGIGTEIYYPLPMHQQECFSALGYRRGDFPHSEAAAQQTLALPIYPELTQSQLEEVAEAVRGFFRSTSP
jgi:dTDP-4-amino-4,6-dideoxygalactose transaminase